MVENHAVSPQLPLLHQPFDNCGLLDGAYTPLSNDLEDRAAWVAPPEFDPEFDREGWKRRCTRLERAIEFLKTQDPRQHAWEDLRALGIDYPLKRWNDTVAYIREQRRLGLVEIRRRVIEMLIYVTVGVVGDERGANGHWYTREDLEEAELRVIRNLTQGPGMADE